MPDMDPAALEAELARLRPLAEMGRMAATVAHEIRNPLTGISANAELLRETLTDPADIESVDIILGEVERLGRLVSDLLHYSRERPVDRKPLDLGWLARTTVEMSQADARKKQIKVDHVGDGVAQGDAELARQGLLNVLRNAIQACPEGGAVRLEVAHGAIAIHDTGAGVPDSLRATLFDPFVTGRTRGLGLGLTVARRCLERQGGRLDLTATGPTGTTFTLSWT
jgi:signal transduction histidine kinase